MRKISVQNLKGGTGKSTTVVNLGAALALKGKKVLLIDTDSQAHIGLHLGVKHSVTLFDLMTIDLSIEEAIINARENLDCIISDKKVAVLETMLVQMPRREEILRLRARRLKEPQIRLRAGGLQPQHLPDAPKCPAFRRLFAHPRLDGRFISGWRLVHHGFEQDASAHV